MPLTAPISSVRSNRTVLAWCLEKLQMSVRDGTEQLFLLGKTHLCICEQLGFLLFDM